MEGAIKVHKDGRFSHAAAVSWQSQISRQLYAKYI